MENIFKYAGFNKVTLKFNLLTIHFSSYSEIEKKKKVELLIEETVSEQNKTDLKDIDRYTVIRNMAYLSKKKNDKTFFKFLRKAYPIQTQI